MAASLMLVASAAVVAGVGVYANKLRLRLRRESHIRTYMFPRGLFDKLAKTRPTLDVKQQQLVARALRQFFSPISRAAAGAWPCLPRSWTTSGTNSSCSRATMHGSAGNRSASSCITRRQ